MGEQNDLLAMVDRLHEERIALRARVTELEAALAEWQQLVAELAYDPEFLDPDSSTVTTMMGLTGKELARRISTWSFDEQQAWATAAALAGSGEPAE